MACPAESTLSSITVPGVRILRDLARELLGFGRVRPLLGDRDRVTFPEQHRQMLLDGVSRHAGQRDAALAGSLAARKPDGERLRNGLRVVLEGLEERPHLVEEDGARR